MEQDNSDVEKILLKVVKHPFITTTILSHSLKKNVSTVDKLMEKFKRQGYVKYARRGLPKSWSITDLAIEKFGFETESERKPRRQNNNSSQKSDNPGSNQSRGNQRRSNQSRGNNQRRDNNENRRQNSRKGKPKQTEEPQKEDTEEVSAVEGGGGQRKGSRKERQEKINELFLFFKDHAEHSFTAQEIAPEFGITVPHLNSLLYELLGYRDVMKQFNTEEQQLVWYLDDMHLESNGKGQ